MSDITSSSSSTSTTLALPRPLVTNETSITDVLTIGKADSDARIKAATAAASALSLVVVKAEDITELATAFGISHTLAERELKKVGGVISLAVKVLMAAEAQ